MFIIMYIYIYALYALLKEQQLLVCMKHTTQESGILVMTLLSRAVHIRTYNYMYKCLLHVIQYIILLNGIQLF